jgi:hypothetical protein
MRFRTSNSWPTTVGPPKSRQVPIIHIFCITMTFYTISASLRETMGSLWSEKMLNECVRTYLPQSTGHHSACLSLLGWRIVQSVHWWHVKFAVSAFTQIVMAGNIDLGYLLRSESGNRWRQTSLLLRIMLGFVVWTSELSTGVLTSMFARILLPLCRPAEMNRVSLLGFQLMLVPRLYGTHCQEEALKLARWEIRAARIEPYPSRVEPIPIILGIISGQSLFSQSCHAFPMFLSFGSP